MLPDKDELEEKLRRWDGNLPESLCENISEPSAYSALHISVNMRIFFSALFGCVT